MTTSISSLNATQSALQVNGVNSVVFDNTGIVSGAGRVLKQIVTFQTGTVATGTTVIPIDNTIPQITEGDQYMSLAITPTNALSTLEIDVSANISNSAGVGLVTALFQDVIANGLAAQVIYQAQVTGNVLMTFKHVMTAGTTSATTFKVRCGSSAAGTTSFNGGLSVGQIFGGVMASRITIKEYLP